MATPTNPRRTFQRASRAQSIISDSSFSTPRPTPPPPSTRLGRGVRANSVVNEAPTAAETTAEKGAQRAVVKLPAHYLLAPTSPSPFMGTLEASLDAIQEWGRMNTTSNGTPTKSVQSIVDALLRPVDSRTNWPILLSALQQEENPPSERWTRYLTEDVLFLLTRTLLPEQILENRNLMARLYNVKKQLAMRLVLRYDMLRDWKMEAGTHHRDQAVAVASVPPPSSKGLAAAAAAAAATPASAPVAMSQRAKKEKGKYPFRRPLLPNIIPTLIAAPTGGFTTHGVRERMKHHVTDLDSYLLLEDDEVGGWTRAKLLGKLCQVVLHWQWMRGNNELLGGMEVRGWEDFEGKADECEWIAEDVKRNVVGGGGRKAVAVAVATEGE